MNRDFRYARELATAERAARDAGAAIMRLFKGNFDIQEKSKNNPVTTADLEANAIIHELLRANFPDDGWLSEEDRDDHQRLQSSRVWVVDPIDGTKEFIEGVPQFSVSIGFVVHGRPQVAVVYNPAKERFYTAAEGQGAFLNGQPIRVTSRRAIDGALLLVSRSEPQRRFQVFMEHCELKPVGSIAYRLAKVAGGGGDATLTFRSIHDWDICAGFLIVQAAGGKVVDGSGKELLFNRAEIRRRGLVASNQSLAQDLQSMWQIAAAQQ